MSVNTVPQVFTECATQCWAPGLSRIGREEPWLINKCPVGRHPKQDKLKNILEQRRQLFRRVQRVCGLRVLRHLYSLLFNQETRHGAGPFYRVPEKAGTSGECAPMGDGECKPMLMPSVWGVWGEGNWQSLAGLES